MRGLWPRKSDGHRSRPLATGRAALPISPVAISAGTTLVIGERRDIHGGLVAHRLPARARA